jgi:outer membrane lipoprotein-sorting protein
MKDFLSKRIAGAVGVALVALAAGTASAQGVAPPGVAAVMKRMDELFRSESSIARIEITVIKPRRTRTLRIRAWTRGREKALIVIESPAREKGTATLKVGNNLWNYLPRISRTIRIPPSMMLGSWMGSDFTNDDLVRESSYEEDYESELVGRSEDPPGWKVVSIARPGVVGLWKRLETVVSDDLLPVEQKFFDRKGRLARVMTFDEVREMGGRRIPTRMVLVPTREEGRRTEMRYLDIEFDVDVPESTFDLRSLERKR